MPLRMWSHGITLGIGLGLALNLQFACKDDDGTGSVPEDDAPQRLSEKQCAAWFACECDANDDRYASEADCRTELAADLQDRIDAGAAAMLTYNSACVGLLIDLVNAFECRSSYENAMNDDTVDLFVDVLKCKLYHGDRIAGQTCEVAPGVPGTGDDCTSELVCRNGICALGFGEAGEGDPCPEAQDCAVGLVCIDLDTNGENACERIPSTGQTCLGTTDLCDGGLYCDQTNKTCQALPAIGDACGPTDAVRCAAGAVCDANDSCVAAPGAGEQCDGICGLGLECSNGRCAVLNPSICGV